jgi:hypothetical protein
MKAIALPFAFLTALATSPMTLAHDSQDPVANDMATTANSISAKQATTGAALRDLWVEHIFWIRNYVTASAANTAGEKQVAADQVVANAKAISGAIAGFYGQPAGDRMLVLLAGHWGAVKAYSDASFSKDANGQHAATTTLVANAKEIAAFLASANPHLPEPTLVGLLSAHGAHHIAQVKQIESGDYAAEAKTWEAMRGHMFTIADALTDALVKQFPARF